MKIPLFDGHCDTAEKLWQCQGELAENHCHVDLKRTREFVPYAQFFAVYGDARKITGPPWEYFLSVIRYFRAQLEKNSGEIALCVSGEEAKRTFAAGKRAAFLSVEGAELLECSPDRVPEAHRLGVRSVLLTWNYDNLLSGSSMDTDTLGLTPLGTRFVRALIEHHMLVDVSHLSSAGFWHVADLCDRARVPFVASHSDAGGVNGHPRNLTDTQFRELARQGGVAGLNFFPEHLSPTGRAGVEDILRHLEHFLGLGGEKSVALGMDLDGIDRPPEGAEDVSWARLLFETLVKRNYPQALIEDLFFNNLMRVVNQVCTM